MQIDWAINDHNLCPIPTATSTASTDTADTNPNANAKTVAKISAQEHILYLPRGIPRNDEWKVFLELMTHNDPTMTATPDEIVTKLVDREAAINRENGLSPEAPLFAKKGGKRGKCRRSGNGPMRDKKDNEDDRKDNDQRKCFLHKRRGHITENCLSKKRGDLPKTADTAAISSTETTSTLTSSLENYWMAASSIA